MRGNRLLSDTAVLVDSLGSELAATVCAALGIRITLGGIIIRTVVLVILDLIVICIVFVYLLQLDAVEIRAPIRRIGKRVSSVIIAAMFMGLIARNTSVGRVTERRLVVSAMARRMRMGVRLDNGHRIIQPGYGNTLICHREGGRRRRRRLIRHRRENGRNTAEREG